MPGIDTNTKLLLQGSNYGETVVKDGSFEILDSAGSHIVTQVGTAQLSTAQSKFGGTSLLLDGNSDYLTIPDSTDWDIFGSNSDDWTIDLWAKSTQSTPSVNEQYIGQVVDSSNFWLLIRTTSNTINFALKTSGIVRISATSSNTVNSTDWYHIALVKKANEYGIYINGTQSAYVTDDDVGTFSCLLNIGSYNGITNFMNGYLDEIRIQKSNYFNASPNSGKTDTITVPTEAYTADANTKLLLHMDSQDLSVQGGNTPNIVDFIGTAQIDTAVKKFGAGSYLFDGNSDYLTIPDSTDFDIFANTSDDWTVDLWVKHADNSNSHDFFSQANGSAYSVFYKTGGGTIRYACSDGSNTVDISTSSSVDLSTQWNHVALIKVGTDVGIYINGTQVAYTTASTAITGVASSLFIGKYATATEYFYGNMDEIRFQKSNYFNALPNSGKTDTITVPTEAYTYDEATGTYIPNKAIIIQ